MKKLLRPVVAALMLGLGVTMIAGCAPRNPNRPAVSQHVCKSCGHTSPAAGKCPGCKVDMLPTTGTATKK